MKNDAQILNTPTGMVNAEGYLKTGAWDTTPKTSFTKEDNNVMYIYTFDKVYDVTFEDGEGSFPTGVDKVETSTNEDAKLDTDDIPSNPTRPDYEFGGWQDEDGKQVYPETETFEKDTVLTPIWKELFTLRIIENTNTTGEGDYVEGAVVTIVPGSKSGYNFAGWKVVSGNVTILSNQVTMHSEDVVIEALWTPIPVVVPTTQPVTPETTTTTSSSTTTTSSTSTTTTVELTTESTISSSTASETTVATTQPTTTQEEDDVIVKLDGKELGDDDYTVDENGNIVLEESFLETLEDGTYTLEVENGNTSLQTEVIVDEGSPLYGEWKETSIWSLFNLLVTVLSLVSLIAYILVKKSEEDEYGNEIEFERKKSSILVLAIFTIISIVLFVLTQNMTLPMEIFDRYSIIFAIVIFVQLIVMYFIPKYKDEKDQHEQNQTLNLEA